MANSLWSEQLRNHVFCQSSWERKLQVHVYVTSQRLGRLPSFLRVHHHCGRSTPRCRPFPHHDVHDSFTSLFSLKYKVDYCRAPAGWSSLDFEGSDIDARAIPVKLKWISIALTPVRHVPKPHAVEREQKIPPSLLYVHKRHFPHLPFRFAFSAFRIQILPIIFLLTFQHSSFSFIFLSVFYFFLFFRENHGLSLCGHVARRPTVRHAIWQLWHVHLTVHSHITAHTGCTKTWNDGDMYEYGSCS